MAALSRANVRRLVSVRVRRAGVRKAVVCSKSCDDHFVGDVRFRRSESEGVRVVEAEPLSSSRYQIIDGA